MSVESELIAKLCCAGRGVNEATLTAVLTLAVEIAREGREGRRVGTLFAVGDCDRVRQVSRPLILDPLHGHPPESRHISGNDLRETVKELAQLDGGFVVEEDGEVCHAARYFDTRSAGVTLPLGLGSRHMAAASVTRDTAAVAVVVSESAVVRLFQAGAMVSEITPEIWLLQRHGLLKTEEPDADVHRAGGIAVSARPAADGPGSPDAPGPADGVPPADGGAAAGGGRASAA